MRASVLLICFTLASLSILHVTLILKMALSLGLFTLQVLFIPTKEASLRARRTFLPFYQKKKKEEEEERKKPKLHCSVS